MTARRVALITGASGGIGADLARIMAREGHDLALVARRADKLARLSAEIVALGRPAPLLISLDLTRPTSTNELATALEAAGATIDILVNNAGYGLNGPAIGLDEAEQIGMIDLNIRSLTEITLRFAPQVIAARGRIMNVASVAGYLPGPGMAIYYATKAYVVSFSQAIGEELRGKGVTVTALCPGFTATEFQARAGIDGKLAAMMPGMTSMAVAEQGYRAMMAGKRRIVTGFFNKLTVAILPFIPNSALLPVISHMQTRRRHD